MSNSAVTAERSAPIRPLDWLIVLVFGLLIGMAVASARLDVAGLFSQLTRRQMGFTIGMTLIVAVVATIQGRRWVRGDSGDDFPIVLLLAIATVQLSGIKVGALTATGLASIPLIVYWFSRKVLVPREGVKLTPLAFILVLLATCSLWTWLWNGFFVTQFAMQVFVKMLTAVVLVDMIDSKERLRMAIYVLIGVLALNVLVGLAQQIMSQGFGIHLSVAPDQMSFRRGSLASSGLGKNRNIFGQVSAIWTAITLYICLSPLGRGRRWWMVPLVLLAASQVYYSFSRGAWAALAFCVLAIPFVKRPAATPFLATGYGLVLAVGVGSGVIGRVVNDAIMLADHTFDARFFLLQRGAEVFGNHFWHGVGLGAFARVDPAASVVSPVHNGLFTAATDIGLPGLLLYALMLGWVIVHLIVGLSKTRDPELKVYAGALLIGALGLVAILQVNAYAYSYLLFGSLAITEAAATLATDGERS